MRTLLALLAICATFAFAQTATTTAPMQGTVTDPQAAVVVGAEITVVNTGNGASFKATTDEKGLWMLPSMQTGTYRVTVSMKGFRTTAIQDVVMNAGVPVTVNAKLELGATTETVEVSGAQELVQTQNATVNSTLVGRQVFGLPNITRNGLDLLVSQVGVQTTTSNRYSSVNGLPNGALNVTLDGLNTQDQLLKSSNGFFTYIPITSDAIEEVTLTTSAAGADASGEGAAQMKFVTKSGTNEFHGGAFYQIRNTALNANYYFNNINNVPRDRVILNQAGVHLGGPALKNKLFFFENFEIRRLPSSASFTRTTLEPSAITGNYTYKDTAGTIRTVNVLDLAKGGGFPSTLDPIINGTLTKINSYVAGNPGLKTNVSSGDYFRDTLTYAPKGIDRRDFNTTRIDYNMTAKHQLSFVYNYDMYFSAPDVLNSVVPIYPGTGTIVGTDIVTGQHSNRFSGSLTLRSALGSHITNEWRGGLNGGTVVFFDGAQSPANYAPWKGYIPNLGSGISGVTTTTNPQRRNSPTKQFNDTLSYLKGSHMVSVGGNWTQVNLWSKNIWLETLPQVTFGIATNDPVFNGTTNVFTLGNMPLSASSDWSNAANLYATLTGRVSSISRQVVLDSKTKQYGFTPAVDTVMQREFGLFAQDTWRVAPTLTLTLGVRYEQQNPFQNPSGVYSAAGLASVWGISGIGNMFKPGTLTGVNPTYSKLTTAYNTPKNFNPSLGIAWQIPEAQGFLGALFGHHQGASVLRAGYNIATVREGTNTLTGIYANNDGLTLDNSVDPSNYPANFGAPGSVLFSQATFPSRPYPTAPAYPFAAQATSWVCDFDPNLKMGYVQSWNVGFQRELTKDTVMEIRYTGNHGLKEWRRVNLNETNTFENGFQKEFYAAYNNLLIARGGNIAATNTNNFSNQGLPGQVNLPILTTGLGSTTALNNATYANYLRRNQVGSLANVLATNVTNMGRLTAGGYAANLFLVNPAVPGGAAQLMTNMGSSYYDALQVEFRRRMAAGLMMQGSYVWSKSLSNGATATATTAYQPTTFRNLGLDRQISTGFDIRHAFKVNWIYELPFGTGRHFLSSGKPVLRKILEGWEIAAVDRNQSGSANQLTSGRTGMNGNETGVVLQNMTTKQLQGMMAITKDTGPNGVGRVWFLPQGFQPGTTTINPATMAGNTYAAFEANSQTWSTLNVSTPYVGPQLAPGQFGYKVFLYGPWQNHFDVSFVKRSYFREKANVEFRANFLDLLNITNFYYGSGPSSAAFGQTTSAYRDLSNSNDPGARMIEFVLRVNF